MNKNNSFSANRKIMQDIYSWFVSNSKPTNIIYYPLKGSADTQQMFSNQLTSIKFVLKFKTLLIQTMDKLFDERYDDNDNSPVPNYQWFAKKNGKAFYVFHVLTLGEYKGKKVYYYALTVTPTDEDGQQTKGAYTLVEVLNDRDKVSEDDFYNNVKKALSKIKDINNKNKVIVNASSERKWKFSDGSIVTASTAEEAKAKHKVMAGNKHPLHEKAVTLCSMLGKKDGSKKFKAYIDYDGPNDEYIMVKTSKFYDTLGSIEITLYLENNKIGIYCRTFDIDIAHSMPEKDFSVKTEKEAVAYVLKVYNAFDKFYETIKDASNKLSDAIKNK